tara:strand:+ start:4910 stop:6016 length:1107 start_codon:yes stop_codon:yes gene_type:complete
MNFIKNKKRVILFLFSFLFINQLKPLESSLSYEEDTEIRSIIIGHLYPIFDEIDIKEKLFKKISNLNPNYIFVLGDSKLNDKNVVNYWRNNFGKKVFFAPGNQEIVQGNLDEYFSVVGYKNIVVETPIVRFLVGNSNSHYSELINFIESNTKDKEEKHNILLLHHRIWDDTLTNSRPYSHDKSYYLKDIYPILKKYISTIFAGNSKHQFFFDKKEFRSIGRQNMNNIYWADRVGNINAYSIGTGMGRPKLGFVEIISNKKNEVIIVPHHIQTEFEDPLPINQLVTVPGSVPPTKSKSNNIGAKIESTYSEFKGKLKRSNFYLRYLNFREYLNYYVNMFYFLLGSFITLLVRHILIKRTKLKVLKKIIK